MLFSAFSYASIRTAWLKATSIFSAYVFGFSSLASDHLTLSRMRSLPICQQVVHADLDVPGQPVCECRLTENESLHSFVADVRPIPFGVVLFVRYCHNAVSMFVLFRLMMNGWNYSCSTVFERRNLVGRFLCGQIYPLNSSHCLQHMCQTVPRMILRNSDHHMALLLDLFPCLVDNSKFFQYLYCIFLRAI